MLLAIDPGSDQSAWLMYRDGQPTAFGITPNDALFEVIARAGLDATALAIESVASYGMAVGAEVFETCVWSGRFIQYWLDMDAHFGAGNRSTVHRVYRRDVKLHLCGSSRAKDANVRQALIDRYGPGKDTAIGRKATPGPLYGITSHLWAALAVAVTVADDAAVVAA